jgi:hypothetical protein
MLEYQGIIQTDFSSIANFIANNMFTVTLLIPQFNQAYILNTTED